MAGVVIRDIRKAYGALEVMSGISLDIDDGEFVVLVGPSGCGKSTLLRMIAGLEEVTSGEIEIDGEVMNDVPPGDRDIAMVFQNYALYPHMTVERNMAFSLRLDRVPKTEIRERVARAARILGLESLLDRYPRNLSGGQRQRVAMGRAIVRDPVVFLFDEPLSNLDAKLRVQMRAEIKELHQKLRTTIVYVTHDQIEAMTLADKVVVMKEGHIEQQGSPLELYDTPQTAFVAGFIGSPAMNLVNGRVKAAATRVPGAGLTVVTEGGVEYPLPPDMTLPEGLEVTVGFRPEHISLDAAGLEARVVVVEPTGAETHVVLRIGDQPITAVFRERYRLRPDESVHVMPDVMRLHVFDRSNGQRL